MFARQVRSVTAVGEHLSLVHFEGAKFGTYLYDSELAVVEFLNEQLKTEAGRAALDLLEKFERLVVDREYDRHERDREN
jgi:hypothetical protein